LVIDEVDRMPSAPQARTLPTVGLAMGDLARLHALSRQLWDRRTAGEVAKAVIREAVQDSGVMLAAAYQVADDGASLQLLCSWGDPPQPATIAPGDPSPTAEAFRARAALYLCGPAEPGGHPRIPVASFGALAAIPLLLQGRPTGALTLAFASPRALDARRREFLEALAQTFAQSLERARIFESEQRSRRAAERYADRIQRLLRITAALAQALSPEDVAAVMVDEAARETEATSADLWLIDEENGVLELTRSMGISAERRSAFSRLPLDGSRQLPAITAVLEQVTFFLETDEELARWPEAAGPSASVRAHGPLAVVPLVVQRRSCGAIVYRYPRGRQIAADERAVVMMIARYAAQALERARLYESERRARCEAQASEARAVAADRRKDEFLAMLGHELRNPLAPILTALHLMRLRDASAHQRERGVIERQVQHLTRLVDDLLDVSRITRGQVAIRTAPLDLQEVIAKAVEMASPLLEARSHRLDVSLPEESLRVQGDGARLSQALSNILNNAAKYTEASGEIHVRAAREKAEVVVRVRDSGMGISPEMLPRVFDLFAQEQRGLDRSQGGLGVGLTIVRSLVEMHGGKVTASSGGAGRGSEFEIRLPALEEAPAEAEGNSPRPAAPALERRGTRVLIVDDNVDAASVLADALWHVGYSTAVAHDGPTGLETARSFQPSVVLLDIGLPVMDGYELASRLRSEAASAALSLVAITGYGQSADKARVTLAGFDEHLVKPVEVDMVLEVLGRLARGSPANAS
jgi:signal transduction histidine kinase/ActR/RegA family two-component response regulator